jgi:recombinational DNA repair protein (RecF pathway)
VSNQNEALAICSEFADEYGFNVEDGETLVVYTESKYLNELKNMLEKKIINFFHIKYMVQMFLLTLFQIIKIFFNRF